MGVLRAGRLPVPPQGTVINAQIEGFVIRRELARGGMGAVYLAEHHRIEGLRKVIKVLLPEFAASPDIRARFEREAAAATRLCHKRVLGIDSFGELPDGQLWLMMPFLDGISLNEYLETHGALTQQEALRVMLQLCAALEHAHQALVVHRDLKPSNIFLCPEADDPWAIKLLDFGIAKILERQDAANTRAGHVVGTPQYMAPEAYKASHHITRRSDIYSAAIIAHELVTRQRPWNVPAETAAGIYYYLQVTQAPTLTIPDWNEVLAQALAVEPSERHTDARAFGLALAMHTTGGMEVVKEVAPELWRNPSAPHITVVMRASDVTLRNRHHDITINAHNVLVQQAPPPQPPASWKLILLGLLVCAIAAMATFAMTLLAST